MTWLAPVAAGRFSDMRDDPSQHFPALDRVRAVGARVGAELDCRLVVLFGSLARGDARAADIDIAVLCDRPVDRVDLTNRLTRSLGTQHVDVSDLAHSDPLLMALVARDGLPLLERSRGEFACFASLAARRYADTRKFRQMERREIQDLIAQLPAAV
jgi:predicted nucleotidyltransferase